MMFIRVRLVSAAGSSCTISSSDEIQQFSFVFPFFSCWTVRAKKGDRIEVGDVDKSGMVEKDRQVVACC